jgi:TonB family protein
MYFDLEDYRPDITPIGGALSWREGVLLSIILHLLGVIVLILSPTLFPVDEAARLRAQEAMAARAEREPTRFVFVQPRVDRPAPKPPPRADGSDLDRQAQTPLRPPEPQNPLPFSRGNSPERVEALEHEIARGRGPTPDPGIDQTTADAANQMARAETDRGLEVPQTRQAPPAAALGRTLPPGGGALGDALRNLQRYVRPEQFENQRGGGGAFGPAIQFDTKGVEIGPWSRRFVAQVKRNWLIPYAAMSMQGHVVLTFNVHKDGSITDLAVVAPCPIDAFNNAAYGALAASNPTYPLPPEYPSPQAFFTVTFFYNEQPPQY